MSLERRIGRLESRERRELLEVERLAAEYGKDPAEVLKEWQRIGERFSQLTASGLNPEDSLRVLAEEEGLDAGEVLLQARQFTAEWRRVPSPYASYPSLSNPRPAEHAVPRQFTFARKTLHPIQP